MAQSSSNQLIKPAQFGGHGKQKDRPYGGIADCVINSRCPPVVTLNTIIIAVCGPNDYDDNAGPLRDGWFFSDFFLFHHLFRGTASEQYWMTCVDPRHLIEKYKEYAHGDPRSNDRRVVLDSSMKEDVNDVLVFNGKDLLERFLSYVTNISKQVKNTNRPILVLIFGHGIPYSYSITIGGTGIYESCPTLTREKFREAILRHNPNPNISILTTSCYGGGWAQSTFLNITTMAGVDDLSELLSWPESISLGRCCGSRYATGVARALIRTEIEGFVWATGEGDEIQDSSTFAALVSMIHRVLTEEIDVREKNSISFSAKDDEWGMEWRARTGFPLSEYEEKWKNLRLLEKSDSTSTSHSASIRFSDAVTLSTPQAEYRLKRLAFDYMRSYPGPNAAAKNHFVHNYSNRLLNGQHLSDRDLEILAGALRYRMETIMGRATEYKDRLGLVFPDCHDYDVFTYKNQLSKNMYDKYSQISRMVGECDLFDAPAEHEHHPYAKGEYYVAMILTESGWDRQDIEDALQQLVKFRSKSTYHHNLLTLHID